MIIRRSSVLFSLLFASTILIFGQEPGDSAQIIFKSETYNFGLAYEADGDLIAPFEFTNTGRSNLKINKIYAPGLNTDDWSKKTLAPGDTAIINFKIALFGQAGYYNKTALLFSNAANSPSKLVIKGKVAGGSYKSQFKNSIGPVSFKNSQLNFGYIFKGEEAIRYAPVINKSKIPIIIKFDSLPVYLSVLSTYDTLEPGENEMIEFRFNTNKCDEWDFILQKISITVYSNDTAQGWLSVSANIREDFSTLSEEEKLNTPILTIPETKYSFDTISEGQKVYYNYRIQNIGTRDLIIRAIKPTCGCTVALPEKTSIPPGDSTHIRVEFSSNGYKGPSEKGVTIITNDPANYKQFLWINGYIK